MPSPFPGMDPYLEGCLSTTVHFSISAEIVRELAPKLRPRYLVLPAERFVLATPESVAITSMDLYPDVAVATRHLRPGVEPATATAEAPLHLATVIPTPVPHVSVEIRDRASRELVTSIEVLSPTNKRRTGRDEYLAKRRQILLSTAHLLEIDWLRAGQRVPMQEPLPPAPYFVFLSRAEQRPLTEVWPIYLNQPLPSVPVPLRPPDADAILDLQQILTAVYDLLGLDLAIDYRQPPEIPVRGEAEQWAEELLRTAGLR
ncbi:MAG TPA: DUF4058 family protein [Ardenticatenaceae bacterium]|nr:DUF4058 family protein [Ardenticatenaceae bacterium]